MNTMELSEVLTSFEALLKTLVSDKVEDGVTRRDGFNSTIFIKNLNVVVTIRYQNIWVQPSASFFKWCLNNECDTTTRVMLGYENTFFIFPFEGVNFLAKLNKSNSNLEFIGALKDKSFILFECESLTTNDIKAIQKTKGLVKGSMHFEYKGSIKVSSMEEKKQKEKELNEYLAELYKHY